MPARILSKSMSDYAMVLRAVAARILTARFSTGARVLDTSDCKKWLLELADAADEAEGFEQFLSQICTIEKVYTVPKESPPGDGSDTVVPRTEDATTGSA